MPGEGNSGEGLNGRFGTVRVVPQCSPPSPISPERLGSPCESAVVVCVGVCACVRACMRVVMVVVVVVVVVAVVVWW